MIKLNEEQKALFKFLREKIAPVGGIFHSQSAKTDDDGKFVTSFMNIIKKPLLDSDIEKHLIGEKQVGVTPLLATQDQITKEPIWVCSWGCLDYDPPKGMHLQTSGEKVLKLHNLIRDTYKDIHPYVERSRDKGFHIWFFFDEMVPAEDCRLFLSHLLDMSGMQNCEIFPKQSARSFTKNQPGFYGNLLNLPFCGYFYKKDRTKFLEVVKRGEVIKFIKSPDQAKLLNSFKITKKEKVCEVVSRIDKKSLPAHIELGFDDFKNKIGKLGLGNSEKGLKKCFLLQKALEENSTFKINFQTWFAICSHLAFFKNWKTLVKEIFSNNNYYPNSTKETLDKVQEIINSGRTVSIRCQKTNCPFANKFKECSLQNISKTLQTEKIKECPYQEDDSVDWTSLKLDFFDELKADNGLSLLWEKGEFINSKSKQKSLIPINDSFENKKSHTEKMCLKLLRKGIDEATIFRMIPYFKFGLGTVGTMLVFWQCLLTAQEERDKQIAVFIQQRRMTSAPQETLESFKHYLPGNNYVGIFMLKKKEDKDTGKITDENHQVSNFVIERKGYVVDKQFTETNDLIDYYHEDGPKSGYKDLLLPLKCRSDLPSLSKELSGLIPDVVPQTLIQTATNQQTIKRITQQSLARNKGKILNPYIQVSEPGRDEHLNAIFFGNSYFHKGKFHDLSPNTKVVQLEDGMKAWVSYNTTKVGDPLIRQNYPYPKYNYINDDKMIFKIRDNFMRWLPTSWGKGRDNGFDGYLIFAWFIATIFKKDIQDRFDSFPFFYMAGNMGSGKNYQASLMSKFLGYRKWEIINVSQSSEAGLVRSVVPEKTIWIDEMKPNSKCDRVQEMLKAAFDCSTYRKASQTDQKAIIDYKIKSNLFFTSQAKPSIEAFEDRSILTYMGKDWREHPKNRRVCALAHKALNHPILGGENLSEIYSWILVKYEQILPNLLRGMEITMDFFEKSLNMEKRACLKCATLFEALKVVYPHGDYPDNVFGLDTYKIEGKKTGLLSHLHDMSNSSREKTMSPIFPFMEKITEVFCTEERKKVFSYVVRNGNRERLYLSFTTAWAIYRQLMSDLGMPENIGKDMMLENLKGVKGFLGHGQNHDLRKIGKAQNFLEFSDTSVVFEHLKDASMLLERGSNTERPYSV